MRACSGALYRGVLTRLNHIHDDESAYDVHLYDGELYQHDGNCDDGVCRCNRGDGKYCHDDEFLVSRLPFSSS